MQHAYVKNILNYSTDESGREMVTIPISLFRQLLASALRAKGHFDEEYYLERNRDVKDAVTNKVISSGAEHYFATGYFEDRMPCKLLIDERFYLQQNPDVAAAIRKGTVRSAQEHFEYTGFKEGRAPYKDFSLF